MCEALRPNDKSRLGHSGEHQIASAHSYQQGPGVSGLWSPTGLPARGDYRHDPDHSSVTLDLPSSTTDIPFREKDRSKSPTTMTIAGSPENSAPSSARWVP